MAENKRSFVLYTDTHHTVKKMSDQKAGQLFKTILAYVNDENPVITDQIIELVFEPIKQQLKRDLTNWQNIKQKRAEAGKLGGRPKKEEEQEKQIEAKKANALFEKQKKQDEAKKAVSVSVSVSDSVLLRNTEEAAAEKKSVGSERAVQVAKLVWEDQIWKEQTCMGLGLNIADLKPWMAQFNTSIATDPIHGFDESKYKKMFRGWLNRQLSNGHKLPSREPIRSQLKQIG